MNVLWHIWFMWSSMAPYLLLGFLLAGILHIFVKADWVKKQLGGSGLFQSVKAVILGIPLPLCSCGVIPVAAGIYKQGASKSATTAFMASTPQTGVDSILATAGILGPFFAGIRVVVAFISGIIIGVAVSIADKNSKQAVSSDNAERANDKVNFREGLKYGLITLPGDIAKAVILGIVIAGILGAIMPTNFLAEYSDNSFITYLLVTLASVPLYVCSTGSIPLAFVLFDAGLSPGAALIFLITGPATNAATISTLWSLMGPRIVFIYISSLVMTAWGSAGLVDYYYTGEELDFNLIPEIHQHLHTTDHIFGLLMLILFANIFLRNLKANKGNVDKNTALKIDNVQMSCGGCANKVKETLNKLEEVEAVEVDLADQSVFVSGKNLPEVVIRSELKQAGFLDS